MRLFSRWAGWLCSSLFLLALVGCVDRPPTDVRPNIILILADDMGFSDIAPYGGEIQTPNLDRLAAGGLRFTQFYNTARCCPTRASLMTGLYPHQAGVGHMTEDDGLPGYQGDLSEHSVTIAQALGEAGYKNYMSGKWHVTRQMGFWTGDSTQTSKHNWPMQRGFDKFYGTILGAGSFYDPVTLTEGNTPIEPETEDYYYTDAISDHAAQYIHEHVDEGADQPFFMYVAYTAPHWPLHARPEDIARYEGRYDEGWDALREERRARMTKMGILEADWPLTPRDPRVPAWEDVNADEQTWYRKAMEVYAAQVDRMDQGIGQVLAALEATGQYDNTLIFFLADNGGCAEVLTPAWRGLFLPEATRAGEPVAIGNNTVLMPGPEESYQSYGPHWANASNTPFRLYKHWVHEGGISTPFIMHWPKRFREKGHITREVGHIIDVMTTSVDAAGATYPSQLGGALITPMEGKSLLPLLDETAFERGPLFWEHEGNRAVREGQWKLVSRYPGDWELYDLDADRSEMNDLAALDSDRVARMAAMYEEWADRANVMPWADLLEHRRSRVP